MKARLLSAVAALILAVIGGVLVTSYVQSADQRALAGTATGQILIVVTPVPAGTPVDKLPEFLESRPIPLAVKAVGALSSLTGAPDTVTAVDLVAGEQLLRSRLVDRSSLLRPGTVKVPAGLQEVTVQLGPDRTVGASIRAGDRVGVFISLASMGTAPAETHLVFQKVLVTHVQGAPPPPDPGAVRSNPPAAAPTGSVLITFALTATEAEKIIFSVQYGTIWLSAEPTDAASTDPGGATAHNVFP